MIDSSSSRCVKIQHATSSTDTRKDKHNLLTTADSRWVNGILPSIDTTRVEIAVTMASDVR